MNSAIPGSEFDGVFEIVLRHGPLTPDESEFLRDRMREIDARWSERPPKPQHMRPDGRVGPYEAPARWSTVLIDRYASHEADVADAAIMRQPTEITKTMEDTLRADHWRVDWIRRQRVGDPESERRIREMLPRIGNTHMQNSGAHRLLQVLASRGDVDAFLEERARWDARRKTELAQLGSVLVDAVARLEGFEAAMALASSPKTRTPIDRVVASSQAGRPIDEIERWFDEHPELDVEHRRLDAVVASYIADAERDEARRADLIERVAASTRERDKAVRDWQLVHLASVGDHASARLIRRARAAIRAPKIKKELSIHLDRLQAEGRLTD